MVTVMRTTVNLPEDILRAARSLARRRGMSFGDALAELIRAGLKPAVRINTKTAFPSFEVGKHAKSITLKQTLRAKDQL
jgi:hypothetical protein